MLDTLLCMTPFCFANSSFEVYTLFLDSIPGNKLYTMFETELMVPGTFASVCKLVTFIKLSVVSRLF